MLPKIALISNTDQRGRARRLASILRHGTCLLLKRCAIPVFFFHIRDGRALAPDDTGTEFADVYAAYLDACRAAEEICLEMAGEAQATGRFSFEITDALGHHLMNVPFCEVSELASRKKQPKPSGSLITGDATAKSRVLEAELATLVVTTKRTVEHARDILRRARGHASPS